MTDWDPEAIAALEEARKARDIAERGLAGELGPDPEDGCEVYQMFPRPPRREPGDDTEAIAAELDDRGPCDFLQAELSTAAAQGDFAEVEKLAAELRRRSMVVETIPWIGWADIMAPLEPLDWVIEGLEIAYGPPAMVAGYGYSGKTISLQSMIVSVAAGLPVWDHFQVEAGPVAHVDGEQGEWLCRDRYQRLCRSFGVDLERLEQSGNMRLVCYPRTRLAEGTEASWRALFEGRRLVLIDSLRALLPQGTDENSSSVRDHLTMLASIAEAEHCAIVVLHHMRKAGQDARKEALRERIRGTSGLFDAVQSCLVFTGDKGEPPVVHHEKARITGKLRDPFALEIFDVSEPGATCSCGDCPMCRWGVRVRMTPVEDIERRARDKEHLELLDAVEGYIRQHNDCSGRMIRKRVTGGHGDILAALDELELHGRIVNLGSHSRPKWRVK